MTTTTAGATLPDACTPAPRPGLAGRLSRALAAPLLLAVVFQNLANFAFHAVVGRHLPAGEYGALGAVLAVMALLSVPLTALQAAASAMVSARGWNAASVRRTVVRTAAAGALVALVVVGLAPAVRGYFRLGSPLDAAILGPFVAVSIVLAVARGLLLGDGRVGAVAGTYAWGTLARFALGVALVFPLGVTGALLGTLAGEAVALAVALLPVARRVGNSDARSALGIRAVALSGLAVTGLFLFSTADLLLARHYLADAATGAYVAAATIGKTVLALPAAAMGVYFPRLVAAWRAGNHRELRTAVVVVSGLALVGALVVAAVPRLLLTVLYGPGSFPEAVGLVRLLAIVAALTSVVSVLTYASLARRSWAMVVPWLGALLEVALISRSHGSVTEVARGSLLALLPTLAAMLLWEAGAWWRSARRTRPAAAGGRHARPVLRPGRHAKA